MALQEGFGLALGLRLLPEPAQRRNARRAAFEAQLPARKASLMLTQRGQRRGGSTIA